MQRRVVITGLGVVSPIGVDKETFWESLLEGRSGIRRVTQFASAAAQMAMEDSGLNFCNYSALQEAICGRNPSIRTICCGQIADLLSNKDSLQAVRA
jgi:3-oxoacyl-(acyl-carrier-protein) synthase